MYMHQLDGASCQGVATDNADFASGVASCSSDGHVLVLWLLLLQLNTMPPVQRVENVGPLLPKKESSRCVWRCTRFMLLRARRMRLKDVGGGG